MTNYTSRSTRFKHTFHYGCKISPFAQRKFNRPFVKAPIQDLQLVNGDKSDPVTDKERPIQVETLASTLIFADHSITSAIPTYMDKYTTSQIRMNKDFSQAYSDRFIRYQATLNSARNAVTWTKVTSPLLI